MVQLLSALNFVPPIVPIRPAPPVISTVGGSKADGVVKFSYLSGRLYKVTNKQIRDILKQAAEKCRNWGYKEYKKAKFGYPETECLGRDEYGSCIVYNVKSYVQCY
ncbi:YecR family lipoprotein [Candidatus Liberibacter brunswickensis]|uniref:YecR family lipoprotein n=1 Tax=Candidatus Liberibacter brunswickensis TaxID=1968796 RepID=UPI0038CC1358